MTTMDTIADAPPEVQAFQQLFQIATGYMASSALQTALKLQIPDRLAAGTTAVDELARDAGVDEDALYRVMRALASLGIFDERAAAHVRAHGSPVACSERWPGLPRHGPVDHQSLPLPRVCRDAARGDHRDSGRRNSDRHAGFEYLAQPENKELSEIFNNAMTGFSADRAPAALDAYDFSGIDTLVDVAGGHGMLLTSILQSYPTMRGILFDLPHVIAGAAAAHRRRGRRGPLCHASPGTSSRRSPTATPTS